MIEGLDVPARSASTPDELDVLLEDAALLGDARAFGDLFERDAVAVDADGRAVRGRQDIGAAAWPYVSEVRAVVQGPRTALVVGSSAIHVARRARDGTWRVALMLHTGAGSETGN